VIDCLTTCARFAGNLLLNIGPRGDGSIQPEFEQTLLEVGRWLRRNGEAVYGTRRTAVSEGLHASGPATISGENVYYFCRVFKEAHGVSPGQYRAANR